MPESREGRMFSSHETVHARVLGIERNAKVSFAKGRVYRWPK